MCLASLLSGGIAYSMNTQYFQVEITVSKDLNGHVLTSTQYQNTSARQLYLAKSAPRFDVFDQKGERVKYVGVMVKRGSLTLDDYEIILPGQTVGRTLDITSLYQFRNHPSGEFVLQLPGGYYDPQTDRSFDGPPVKKSFNLHTVSSSQPTKKGYDQLSEIEKRNLPDDGFPISTGGTQNRAALYFVNLNDCVIKRFQGGEKGQAISSDARPVETISLKSNQRNKLREMIEQIQQSGHSYSRFPPQSAGFNLTMTIRTSKGLKYVNSYGRPVGEVATLFDYLLQVIQANQKPQN